MDTKASELNNPPAFPGGITATAKASDDAFPTQSGMTLRDYFAARALSALIRNYSVKEEFDAFTKQSDRTGLSIPMLLSQMAYENADAMLAARLKQP